MSDSTIYERDNGERVEVVHVAWSTFCGGRAEQTVLVIREGGAYVALGVQHDLAAQGTTIENAREEFLALVEAERAICLSEIQRGDPDRPLRFIPPAPEWHRKAAIEHVREVFGANAGMALRQLGLSEEG